MPVLFHLFEYLVAENEYYRTSFNHDLNFGSLLLNVQTSLTVAPTGRPGIVGLHCNLNHIMVVGYVTVLVNK